MPLPRPIRKCGRDSRMLSSSDWRLLLADWMGRDSRICLMSWCSRGVFLSLSAREDWRHTILWASNRMVWRNGSSTPCRSEEQMVTTRTRKWICYWIRNRASKGSIGVWRNMVKIERASCMLSIFLMLMLLPSSTENTASRLLLLIVKRQVLYEKNL